MRIKKTFYLSNDTIDVIHEVMKENQIKSEVRAVTYMITKYKNRADMLGEFVRVFNETNSE